MCSLMSAEQVTDKGLGLSLLKESKDGACTSLGWTLFRGFAMLRVALLEDILLAPKFEASKTKDVVKDVRRMMTIKQ